jgi:flavin-dependent dehydrogenase
MDVDVAIIGGGPAGCSAALALCANGHSVAVIESPLPRNKSTEMASPALRHHLQLLNAAGALSACEPCFGISSSWGRRASVLQPSILNPFGHFWFIHRARFDLCLKLAAISAGTIWIDDTARRIHFDQQHVLVATVRHNQVRGKWLIFATGSPAWPARVTQQNCSTIDRLIAYWARLPMHLEERVLFVEASDHGWWYMCPGGDEHSVACFITDSSSSRLLRVSKLDNWNMFFQSTTLSRRFTEPPIATSNCVVSSALAALARPIGTRWIAVGDAAAKLDPLGGAGLLSAIGLARRGAFAVSGALRGNGQGLLRYASSVRNLIQRFVRERYQQYAIEASHRTGAFWTARLRSPRHSMSCAQTVG